ncbi:hypothetical protein A3X38_28650, partial [Salmonella enterica subsp. enterica serovar Florida]|nr:hypothetical protein [Salmonella enterica subsp. enterica serovar Florida]
LRNLAKIQMPKGNRIEESNRISSSGASQHSDLRIKKWVILRVLTKKEKEFMMKFNSLDN